MKKRDLLIEDPFIDGGSFSLSSLITKASKAISSILTGNLQNVKSKLSFVPNIPIDKLKHKLENNFNWFGDVYNYYFKMIDSNKEIDSNKYLTACMASACSCYGVLLHIRNNKETDINKITSNDIKLFAKEIMDKIINIFKIIKNKLLSFGNKIRGIELSADQIVGVVTLIVVVFLTMKSINIAIDIHKNYDNYSSQIESVTRFAATWIVFCLIILKFLIDFNLVTVSKGLEGLANLVWGIFSGSKAI
jgi:hypothetical protein